MNVAAVCICALVVFRRWCRRPITQGLSAANAAAPCQHVPRPARDSGPWIEVEVQLNLRAIGVIGASIRPVLEVAAIAAAATVSAMAASLRQGVPLAPRRG